MKGDATITPLHQPGTILDPLTGIAREGARQMLAAALKAEAASVVAGFTYEASPDGRQRVVHHGTGPARMIRTRIGAMPVQRHKMRDRSTAHSGRRWKKSSPAPAISGQTHAFDGSAVRA